MHQPASAGSCASHEMALEELRVNAGTQFDPGVVQAALTVLTREARLGEPLATG